MGKKRNNSKKETVNVFKVSEGRAKRRRRIRRTSNSKKFNTRTSEEVDSLNKNLDNIEHDVRKAKRIEARSSKPIVPISLSTNDVNIEEAIADFSNL